MTTEAIKAAADRLETAARSESEARTALEAIEDKLWSGAATRAEFRAAYEALLDIQTERLIAERQLIRAHGRESVPA